MTNPATKSLRVLGCDVAKDTIAVFDTSVGKPLTVENNRRALKALFKCLKQDVFVVCEATGGYEAVLLDCAHEAGLPVHRADPRKAKAFVRSLRTFAKSDALDAQALAVYGVERHHSLPLWQPLSQGLEDLRKLVRLRTDLVQCRADYKRRFSAPGDGPDKPHIEALIEDLTLRIKRVEADIETCVNQEARTKQITEVIETIPGCGHIAAFTLAALMPELGQISNRQAASLSGLAPHPNDTGKSIGYRSTRGGRRNVKIFMFMIAMTARQHNPNIRTKFDDLVARGKKPMVALIACARKLITIINAKIRDAIYINQNQLS